MTEEGFGQLLKTYLNGWLKAFLSNFSYDDVIGYYSHLEDDEDDEDDPRPKCLDIEHVAEYESFGKNQKILGFYIKHVETVGGDYDGSDIDEVFAIYKDGNLITHFMVSGNYNSYEYNEFNNECIEVEHREVKVMQWLVKGV